MLFYVIFLYVIFCSYVILYVTLYIVHVDLKLIQVFLMDLE